MMPELANIREQTGRETCSALVPCPEATLHLPARNTLLQHFDVSKSPVATQDNVRALLSTLHTVLWDNSGWQPLGMTDLVEPNRVKRSYMKVRLPPLQHTQKIPPPHQHILLT